MNILCICYEYPPIGGGGGPACQGVCEAIVAAGHTVDVVTSAMEGLPDREVRRGVRIYRHRCLRRHAHYSTAFELMTGIGPAYRLAMELAEGNRYDLIHCHFAVPSGLVAWLVARRTGLPYIITAHGSDIPGYNPDRFELMHTLIRPMWRTILRGARVINTPSHYLRRLLQTHLDVPVEVIPYGFTPAPTPDVTRHNRILVVTRMFERKGVQHVIEAMRGWSTDWELHIAGDGPYLPALKEQAQASGVPVTFHGYVRGQPLIDLYHSAKVFTMPSSSENFPVVLLEALAAGCAIVTSANTGCAEVVGDAGVCVEAENPAAIGAALRALTADPARVNELGAAARRRVERFHWCRIGAEFERLYLEHARTAAPHQVTAP